jgi:aspartate aminotransferase
MAFLNDRIESVEPSPTLSMKEKATRLKSQGRDIISLSTGEPDFDTPDHIKAAAKKAMDAGKTKYTAVGGVMELKKAIAAKFRTDNNLRFDTNQIMAATGGKQILYNALAVTLNPGDEVVIQAPYWVSYPSMVKLAGGVPVLVNGSPSNDFKMTADALNDAITDNTKWVILNSPANPTGAVYGKQELRQFADVLMEHPTVRVLSDDIYEKILYDQEFFTIAQVEPELAPRTLTMNGVSKSHAMTGWRLGYAGGPADLISAMTKLQGQSTSNPSSISQWAAVAALTGDQHFLSDWVDRFERRRDQVIKRIDSIDGLTVVPPSGAFYLFVKVAGLIGADRPDGKTIASDMDVADYLLDHGVAVVPGAAFGLEPYIRMSYAAGMEDLMTAMDRIKGAVETLSGGGDMVEASTAA